MPEGVIINLINGTYGFIRVDGQGREDRGLFFHKKGLAPGVGFQQLAKGCRVRFEVRGSKSRSGDKEAYAVRPLPKTTIPVDENPCSVPAATAAAGAGSRGGAYPPYRFAPIDIERAVTDVPVWHDGTPSPGGTPLYSGELHCTLVALTPLLPGNHRYAAKDAAGATQVAETEVQQTRNGQHTRQVTRCRLPWKGLPDVDPEKQIAEPLRLADGRVVIAGSALKGMLRHSLGALLSAPMERVAEHHYTYRPNLDLHKKPDGLQIVCRAAVVDKVDGDRVTVRILPQANCAIFARSGMESGLGEIGESITEVPRAAWKIDDNGKQDCRRLVPGEDILRLPSAHTIVSYRSGIDGDGLLARESNDKAKPHRLALVPEEDSKKPDPRLDIPPSVLEEYCRTQLILADRRIGHLHAHPKISPQKVDEIAAGILAGKRLDWLRPDHLLYLEVRLDARGEPATILSMGHHFRYRVAYTSSVRRQAGEPRPCLNPLAVECGDVPERLSGARLLFGYVRDDETLPIGRGAHARLAGRIAVNHALSEAAPEFLNPQGGCCVPLKVLGLPRPSAWEFYLRQNGHAPVTYGDLPGEAGGELAGRKFYLHQPGVKAADYTAGDPEAIRTAQAPLARFVCRAGSRFRFTVRFDRLRQWELGALLAVLEPRRLAPDGTTTQYAHKLGLGRPLGLGSVAIRIEGLCLREAGLANAGEADLAQTAAMQALKAKLGNNAGGLDCWLALHAFVDRGRLDYPRSSGEIFNWHTRLRRSYSKYRREAAGDATGMMEWIRAGHSLPVETGPGEP